MTRSDRRIRRDDLRAARGISFWAALSALAWAALWGMV